jgi:NTE family protein
MFQEAMPKRAGQKVALVLCGGGSRGAVEIGFYRALVEMGIPIDLIVGSSMGALNGAFIAAGVSVNEIYDLWRRVRFRDLFGSNWSLLVNPRKADGIYDNRKLRRFLERHLPARRFEELRMPLTIVATDLETGECVRLERGDLIEAVLASVAIPGLLPPVPIGQRRLVDGGIVNNLPFDVAVEKGATTILAMLCQWQHSGCTPDRQRQARGIVNILSRSLEIADTARHQHDLAFYAGQSQMIVLEPQLHFEVGLLDFSRTVELVDEACCITMSERAVFTRLITDRQAAEAKVKAAEEPTVDLYQTGRLDLSVIEGAKAAVEPINPGSPTVELTANLDP